MFVIDNYDVVVIGAGHAGCEAALASARMGKKTLMATLNLDNIALMPCNPAVGGPGKSHLVRELDALGGQMGINTDETCIQMRMLNTGKGPAVYSLRAQSDKKLYQQHMTKVVETQKNLDVKQLMITDVIIENNEVRGVKTELDEIYGAKCVILATGTYLKGKVILGEKAYSGGPVGQRSAENLSASLQAAGVELMRFKTGTPARVDRRTLRYGNMSRQDGDVKHHAFSFLSEWKDRNVEPCWLTFTNEETHTIIRNNLQRAPMFNGLIDGVGPRYCPSIESKIVSFADKTRHQLFIEPEGLMTEEMYVQGMSTSLPIDVQYEFLRTIPGLEDVQIMRPGYAIEYDCLNPLQLKSSLELKKISGLFSAGQANGTSGYEEAAAQGLIAGINAARKLQGKDPLILTRADAYIGVLIDDLVTKGTDEPYRMMTSRSEYRLILRQDNADLRLTQKGYDIGLVTEERYQRFLEKKMQIQEAMDQLKKTSINPTQENQKKLTDIGTPPIKAGLRAYDILRRTEMNYDLLRSAFPLAELEPDVREEVEIMIKYEGYIGKQMDQVKKLAKLEAKILPDDLIYEDIKTLSLEAQQKLGKIRPRSLGQASRISGVSPADLSALMIALEQRQRGGK